MPDPVKPGTNVGKAKIAVGAGVAAAMAVAVPLVAKWEGKRNDPYRDIIGVPTVCYGETHATMRRYSDAECVAMLETALLERYTIPVIRCTPVLVDRPYQLAAAASLAYNIGTSAYCGSTAARRFNSGDQIGGCRAIAFWNRAGGRVVQGLVSRRAYEVRVCLKGMPV